MAQVVRHPKTQLDVPLEEIEREVRELEDMARSASEETRIRIGREIDALRAAKADAQSSGSV